ncbi:MAG: ATP-binding protein, partial [Oligoflexia bacterium]|nr:ATP-binding protein [Oligoflexia bacterium]
TALAELLFFSCFFTDARKKFHKEIKNHHHKHLALFSDEKSFFSLSYLSKDEKVKAHSYFKGQSGDYFISKLAGVHFGIEDAPDIVEIGNRLEKTFDTEKVTKRFFENFKNNHNNFLKYIDGIENEEEEKWFASLILNRMMFIWFLQKKGFVDEDFDYLETKLAESKQRGKDRYYSEFLTLLFFEGFAKKQKERSEEATKLLGKIKYLNGGLFVPHPIEDKYKNKIKVQDKAFDETFAIFKKYDWNLQGKEGKSDNEISPDVMGYIFEKYINELQQKSLGAYYTRDEITSYLSRNTIQKCVLEKVNSKEHKFETVADMLHKLSADLCKLLLTDEDSILNTLTVLDPAVGSGAFLVSAMKELIDIYSPIIDKIETLGDRDLTDWLKNFKEKNKSVLYGIKKNIILKNLYGVDIMKEATEVCKLRLFLSLVSSALKIEELEPLPNMDFNIMCGNSLIGFLREEEKAKENEKQLKWDAVLGESYQQIKEKYNKLIGQYKNKVLSFEKLKELKHKILHFLDENNSKLNLILVDKCNKEGLKYPEIINSQGEKKNIRKRTVLPKDFYPKMDSINLKPFHWDFSFNSIIKRGGFDILITNPPWDKINLDEKEFFAKYDPNIDKKKTKTSEMAKIKTTLLNDHNIMKSYHSHANFYSFQRSYFLKFYQCEINNETSDNKKSSAHMDNYRLFTERCFELLNKGGRLGIVLPSGLHKDDGAVGLRKEILFSKVKIEGLIDFQNQMGNGKGKIFEGVDSRFKFLLLNFKKDKPQDIFPCQFMERDLKVLDENQFLKNPKMKQSIKEIKTFAPCDWSVIEFKNPKDKEILKKAIRFPKTKDVIKNLWNPYVYTEELNETRSAYLFSDRRPSESFLPVYKGDNIYQYSYRFSNLNRYLDKDNKVISKSLKPCLKNKYYENYRLVIRTVASNTNERSLISAVIPKGNFISNSLHGVYIESNTKNRLQLVQPEIGLSSNNAYMLLLQSFFNSFVVDYFIRQKVSSNINKKYITPLHIPRLTKKDDYFKELVERSAKLTCIGKEFNELADEIGIQRGGVKDKKNAGKYKGK